MAELKILFASSDGISLACIESIRKSFNLVAILTVPQSGSGRKVVKNPVAEYAKSNGIRLIEAEHLNSETRDMVKETGADFLVSFSFSRIFGPKFLSLFSAGTMNIHPSRLPEFRGPSPVQALLLDGRRESSISFQEISLKMDEGDIYRYADFTIAPEDNAETLRAKISAVAAANVSDVIKNRNEKKIKQSGTPSYTSLIKKEDGRIDFTHESAAKILNKIRAYCIWPRAYCTYNRSTLFILDAEIADETDGGAYKAGTVFAYNPKKRAFLVKTADGVLAAKKLMIEGRKPMAALDFRNGHPEFEKGAVLE